MGGVTPGPPAGVPDERSLAFYREVLRELDACGVPYLIGGAYAFRHYTGIDRCTRDLDAFMLPEDVPQAIERLRRRGHAAELVFPHWLAKILWKDDYVDLIFSSGNGVARVDPIWFERADSGAILGHPVRFCPPEEMIWSKAYIMERERFDGSDVLHLIHARGAGLDWRRLLARFGTHGRVLLSHLVLYGFVYPGERDRVPDWVIDELLADLQEPARRDGQRLCRGTLLSRSQYLVDLVRGYRDGRLPPEGRLSAQEVEIWTAAAEVPEPRDVTPDLDPS